MNEFGRALGTGSSEMTIPAVAGFVGGWTLFREVMQHVGDAPTAAAVRAAALQIHLPMGVWYIPRPMQPPRLDSPPERLGMQPAAARAAAIGVLALGLEWARAMAARQPETALVCLVVGGVALGALGLGFAASQLGLSRSRLAFRLLGWLVLGALLLLPSAVRESPLPQIPAPFAVAAVAVSVGEEIAFRKRCSPPSRAGSGLVLPSWGAVWSSRPATCSLIRPSSSWRLPP